MRKNFYVTFILVMTLSMLLGACSTPASTIVDGKAPGQAAAPGASSTPTGAAPSTAAPAAAAPAAALLPPQTVQGLLVKLMDSIPANKGYGYIQPEALKANLGSSTKLFLVDVRDPSELDTKGYIDGAVNIPLRTLLQNLDKLPAPDANIVIYSNSGYRSGMALEALSLLGYTNVHDLAGGFSSWVNKSQFPVVTGKTPAAPQVLTQNPAITDQALFKMLGDFLSNLPDDYYQITDAKLSEELSGSNPPVVVDMNLPSDHAQYGTIKGSVNIPFSDFFNNLDKLPSKDTPIVIYSVGGGHSSVIVMGLREMGYTNVFSLQGGIIDWKNNQYPVESGGNP